MASILIVVAVFLNLPIIKVVSISNRKNFSERIYSKTALDGFVISYTHSVNKGRIHDFYVVDGSQFILTKSVFVSYGAGIPEPEEIAGCDFEITDNGFILDKINERLDRFLLAVGVVAEHSLSIGEKEFFLKNFFPAQTSLLIDVRHVSILNYCATKKEFANGKSE